MTLFLALVLMLALAATLLVWPFFRRFRQEIPDSQVEASLLKEQMQELDRETRQGFISETERDATKLEIERRALRFVKQAEGQHMNGSRDGIRIAGIAISVGLVSLGSAIIYSAIGRPELTGTAAQTRQIAQPAPLLLPGMSTSAPLVATAQPLADVNTMITRLANRLKDAPGDVDGWRMLGWSYAKTRNHQAAVQAFARAVSLQPQNDEFLALYGEAVVRSAGGTVSEDARQAFARSLTQNPANLRAIFYTGLAMRQDGDSEGAFKLWLDLAGRSSSRTDWTPDLIRGIRELGRELDQDVDDQIARLQPPAPQQPRLAGPTAEDLRAADALSPAERQDMIRSMVDGLADRLAQRPDDPEGWARLIRSYAVLGQQDKAETALAQARILFAQQDKTLTQLNELAAGLGFR